MFAQVTVELGFVAKADASSPAVTGLSCDVERLFGQFQRSHQHLASFSRLAERLRDISAFRMSAAEIDQPPAFVGLVADRSGEFDGPLAHQDGPVGLFVVPEDNSNHVGR